MRGWQTAFITMAIVLVALAVRADPLRIGIPAAVVLTVVGALVGRRRRARAGRLRRWARATGWDWWGDDDQSLAQVSHHYPFDDGPRTVAEAMRGTYRGRPSVSFVLRFRIEQVQFHVVAVALPMWLPSVDVLPETFAVKVEKATGAQDIRLESEQFNEAFRVQSRDDRAAFALLQPVLMERLLRDDASDVAWRTDGTWVLSWQSGATDLDSLARRLEVLSAVAASIRPHVWQQHGIDTTGWDPTAPPTSTL